jgi:hypothetical protein
MIITNPPMLGFLFDPTGTYFWIKCHICKHRELLLAQGNKIIIPEMCCGSVWVIETFHHDTILCA